MSFQRKKTFALTLLATERLQQRLWILIVICVLIGCNSGSVNQALNTTKSSFESVASKGDTHVANTEKTWPADLVALAEVLSMPIRKERIYQRKETNPELVYQENLLALKRIQSSDKDIAHVVNLAIEAYQNAVQSLQRIKRLPKLQDSGTLFVESFVYGALGDLKRILDLGSENENARKAWVNEIESLAAAADQQDVAHQLLHKLVERYSVAPQSSTARPIVIDFDEGWTAKQDDGCKLANVGAIRRNCFVVVEISGARGQIRKNVHFVKEWGQDSWLYCSYSGGIPINDQIRVRRTVTQVEKVKVTVFEPEQTTVHLYTYDDNEKAIDAKVLCDALPFSCRYRPYEAGILITNERGVYIQLLGGELPACRVTINFISGSQSKSWYWDVPSWACYEEKKFETPKEGLTFDPTKVEMTLSISNIPYQHTVSFNLKQK